MATEGITEVGMRKGSVARDDDDSRKKSDNMVSLDLSKGDSSFVQIEPEEGTRDSGRRRSGDFCFKSYVIVSMTVIWTSYTILLRYTRTSLPKSSMYFSTTVVFLAESLKFSLSWFFLLRTHNFDWTATKREFLAEYVNKPRELVKMSVPSIVYAVQNNLDFVALSNLDAGVYQVTSQLKVVTTAIFMVLMLGRRYSLTRWVAILFLFGGVALVQLDAIQARASPPAGDQEGGQNYFVGITAVLITCATAGFAGVYFEKMLKDGSQTSFWIRNLQLYTSGIVSAGIGCMATDGLRIADLGFFFGYNTKVWIIVALLSVGGIYISLVMKHLDNLLKSFASAVSIILVCLLSYALFHSVLGFFFILGSFTVCGSILLYNSVPE